MPVLELPERVCATVDDTADDEAEGAEGVWIACVGDEAAAVPATVLDAAPAAAPAPAAAVAEFVDFGEGPAPASISAISSSALASDDTRIFKR